MGNKPLNERHHFVVFGAKDTGDKSLLAYKDKKTGTYAIKILQNTADCRYAHGEAASTDFASIVNETDGEYITLYFADKNGVKSIDTFMRQLETVKGWMEQDAEAHYSTIPPLQEGEDAEELKKQMDIFLEYTKGKDCGWR